jgi:hypothetical protein
LGLVESLLQRRNSAAMVEIEFSFTKLDQQEFIPTLPTVIRNQ